ncbi:MAG TPA: metalloregulator ArsR/SmtB family transcription factor [Acidimicrobiia bacterium]|jgi:ArsR family transcriptional regulator|nr:metalloregulator ArsR/SmtB family transcription factor [Acidimicrobiia bacterium]
MAAEDVASRGCLDGLLLDPPELTDAEMAAIGKALGHPVRIAILELFHVHCPRTVGGIVSELPLAQSTVSKHLAILRDAGLVRTIREESRTWHCLNRSVITGFGDQVIELARRAD